MACIRELFLAVIAYVFQPIVQVFNAMSIIILIFCASVYVII